MSKPEANQQFQPPQGLRPTIPFDRPPQASQPQLRPRVETPIHPPQFPQGRAPHPTLRAQQAQAPQGPGPQSRRQQQPARPPRQPPQPPQHFESQQADLDEQFRQAEQAYLAAYHPNAKPQAIYHTIDPTKTTLAQEPPYVLYRPPLPETPQTPQTPQAGEAQQPGQRDLRFVHSHSPAVVPQQTPQQIPQQANQQAEGQASGAEDDAMQDGESGSDDDEEEENTGEVAETPKDAAPLVQPVTPLQYPAVRPTLLLGPYETREEAQKAAVEYGIAQGYMLVQSGCARAKTAWGGYEAGRPIVRIDLMCDRSGTCKNMGTGKRKRATHKIGCPTRIKIVCRKRDGCKWFIDPRVELHNHDLNVGNMESIASYRRWRRMQEGGASAETRKERSERKKRLARGPRSPAPVPPPAFHNTGPQPAAEPTGPVHMAALKGQIKILEILLNKGADPDAYDSTGRTPLHCALEGSRMDAFKLLVDRGVNVTRCDSKGLSPLRMAVEKGLEDAVVVLIEKGADPNK